MPKGIALKDEEVLEVIKDMIDRKCFLSKALEGHDVSMAAFYKRIESVPSLKEEYERARVCVVEFHVQELVDISDNDPDPQRARNRIDVRKWLASKLASSQYGDKLELNIHGQVDIRGALEEARARVRSIYEIPKTQIAETTPETTVTKLNPPGLNPGADKSTEKTIDDLGSTEKSEAEKLWD